MAPAQQKPVTLLKRQHAAPATSVAAMATSPTAATAVSERVADAIRGIVDTTLARERARMQSLYVARQEALLKVLADVLRDNLRAQVAAAASREAAALVEAVKVISDGAGASTPTTSSKRNISVPVDDVAAVRAAFQKAFDTELLGAIESAVGDMMATISSAVDVQVETSVAAPSADKAARALRSAADQVRADTAHFSAVARVYKSSNGGGGGDDEIEVVTPVNKEDAVLSKVVRALDERRVRDAIELSLGCSATVRAKALSGALDSDVSPDDLFAPLEGRAEVTVDALTGLIALLSSDLNDRTSRRLEFLMEATMNLEDAPRGKDRGDAEIMMDVRHLEAAIAKLQSMHMDGDVTPTDIKQAKLLVRCLKVTVQSMKL
jgi:hypothetical protein